jgi:hypothetical protein
VTNSRIAFTLGNCPGPIRHTKVTRCHKKTTDNHLMNTKWRMLAAGKVMSEQPRYVAIRNDVNHMTDHRRQLTVYLRLYERKVPAIYGPSAGEGK